MKLSRQAGAQQVPVISPSILPDPAKSNARPVIARTIAPARSTSAPKSPAQAAADAGARNGGFNQSPAPVVRGGVEIPAKTRLSVASTPAPIYGCTGLFDLCGDADLMSLSLQGQDTFLDWLGWQATDVCRIQKNFVSWVRPKYNGGTPTTGYIADPCVDGNTVEWGDCDFILTDFGRLRRTTPVRDLTKSGLRLCEAQPRYRLDGEAINNDDEFDMRIVTEGLLQDLKRGIVNFSKLTSGQFDGLERLVNTGYVNSEGRYCRIMDSVVIDWNANDFDGGSGVTWNGASVGTTFGLIDVIIAAVRRIRQRISWAPALASQRLEVGDMAFVAPTHINQCILDAYTCWRVCPGQAYNETNLNSLEAREFRNSLMGGAYGAGRIYVDGFEIPLINYDWGLIKGPTRSDAYLLTRKVGSTRLINGQYNDMRVATQVLPEYYDATDGGRLLTWADTDNTCYTRSVEMQPRLLMWAPWAQARFIDLKCSGPVAPISPDPEETSFFPETSFSVAA